MPRINQLKNRELKCAAQFRSKLTDLFKKLRPDDQPSTSKSLNDITGKNMQEEPVEKKKNYVFFNLYQLLSTLYVFINEIHAT